MKIKTILCKSNHFEDNSIFWITIAFVIRMLYVGYRFFPQKTGWGFLMGDTNSYFQPIENLLKFGEYTPDYRLPAYGFVYLIPRFFTQNINYIYQLIILFQIFVGSMSVYFLAKMCYNISKKQLSFYLAFFLYAVNHYVILYDMMLLTESLSISFLIIATYLFTKNDDSVLNQILIGFLLTFVAFMRPVAFPIVFIFAFFEFFKYKIKMNPKKALKMTSAFLMPFLLIESAWVVRNYNKYHRFVPVSQTVFYPQNEANFFHQFGGLISSFGKLYVYNERNNPIGFETFEPTPIKLEIPSISYHIISYHDVYTSRYNADSISFLFAQYVGLIKTQKTQEQFNKTTINKALTKKVLAYKQAYRLEKPLTYYIKVPIVIAFYFFVQNIYNPTDWLFGDLRANKSLLFANKWEVFSWQIFYSGTFAFAFIGFVFYLLRIRSRAISLNIWLLFTCSIYLVSIYPFIMRVGEWRYFATAHPFLFIFAIEFIIPNRKIDL